VSQTRLRSLYHSDRTETLPNPQRAETSNPASESAA
jgi:hypothetical protein